jgi:probable HAF family extracellular repeat protein
MRCFRVAALIVTGIAPSLAQANSLDYTIVALPGAPTGALPAAINNNGVIASFTQGFQQGYVTQPGGSTAFFVLPNSSSVVTGINASGQVVGSGASTGFIYSNGVTQTFTTGSGVTARAINDSGTVAGTYSSATGNQAYTYSNGQFQSLGTLPSFTQSLGFGINDSGEVVGNSGNGDGVEEAFLYADGVMQGLGTLPGDSNSSALSINNLGQVTGQSWGGSDGNYNAFIYDPGTGLMTALGDVPGVGSAGLQTPAGINDSGEIVGFDTVGSNAYAFLYSDGSMYNLADLISNDSGWVLGPPVGINDSGEIVGLGRYEGVEQGYVLYASPEPNARFVCLAFAILFGVARLKRRLPGRA